MQMGRDGALHRVFPKNRRGKVCGKHGLNQTRPPDECCLAGKEGGHNGEARLTG